MIFIKYELETMPEEQRSLFKKLEMEINDKDFYVQINDHFGAIPVFETPEMQISENFYTYTNNSLSIRKLNTTANSFLQNKENS